MADFLADLLDTLGEEGDTTTVELPDPSDFASTEDSAPTEESSTPGQICWMEQRVTAFLQDADSVLNAETLNEWFPTETFENTVAFLLEYEMYFSHRTVAPTTIISKSIKVYVRLVAQMIPGLLVGTAYGDLTEKRRVQIFKKSTAYVRWLAQVNDDWGAARFGFRTSYPMFDADIKRILSACEHGIHGLRMAVFFHFVRCSEKGPRGSSW
jgi:hypothetical protein